MSFPGTLAGLPTVTTRMSDSPLSHDSDALSQLTPNEDDNEDSDEVDEVEAGEDFELEEYRPTQVDLNGFNDGDKGHAHHALLAKRRRRRRTSMQSYELYTPDEERRVKQKLDIRLVLFVALLYLMSFLDRSNIGNAKIAGLKDDLRLSDNQYEWLLTAFYITYILFEWMTLCYKVFPPHIYISCCVCAWGVLASLQSLVVGYAPMLLLRALLGISEAAFVGIPIYLSFFFRREELAFRTGLFISAAPLATSFASSLAFAIVSIGEKTDIATWRLLFLVEGFPACFIAIWAWYWIPDSPATAHWLTSRERKVASIRMRRETATSTNMNVARHSSIPRHKQKFKWREVLHTLREPKSYLTAAIFFCCNVAFSSMPVFLPTIINAMGFSHRASQGLSAPPFLLAFFVVLATALVSDRIQSRSIPLMFHAAFATVGYIVLAIAGSLQLSTTLRYITVFPICAGFFSAVTLVITWTLNNQSSDEGKGTGMAVLNVIGQLGPLVGTRLYPDSEGPYYVKGMTVCAGAMAIVVVLAFVLKLALQHENARRRVEGASEESLNMT